MRTPAAEPSDSSVRGEPGPHKSDEGGPKPGSLGPHLRQQNFVPVTENYASDIEPV